MERTAHDPIPGAPCKPSKIKALRRFDSTFRIRFRVGAVMTASHIISSKGPENIIPCQTWVGKQKSVAFFADHSAFCLPLFVASWYHRQTRKVDTGDPVCSRPVRNLTALIATKGLSHASQCRFPARPRAPAPVGQPALGQALHAQRVCGGAAHGDSAAGDRLSAYRGWADGQRPGRCGVFRRHAGQPRHLHVQSL